MAELDSTNKYQFIDFYCGFNGEGEVILYADNGEMHIWDGYFGPIMNCALDKEVAEYKEAFGVVAQYQTCTGWCDVSADKTVVESPERELAVLKFKGCWLRQMNFGNRFLDLMGTVVQLS